jgi:hypothetical protein
VYVSSFKPLIFLVVKSNEVSHLYCPQYEGLKISDIMKNVDSIPELQLYFPKDEKDRHRLPKQFILNVAYSVVGENFAIWVKEQIDRRNAKVTKEKDLLIGVDSAIAMAFSNSTSVSCRS